MYNIKEGWSVDRSSLVRFMKWSTNWWLWIEDIIWLYMLIRCFFYQLDYFNRTIHGVLVCIWFLCYSRIWQMSRSTHLFRQTDEFTSRLEVLTLQRSGGRESPAATASLLVLYLGDVSLSSPVDGVGSLVVGWWHEVNCAIFLLVHLISVHHGNKLLIGLKKVEKNADMSESRMKGDSLKYSICLGADSLRHLHFPRRAYKLERRIILNYQTEM